MPVVIVHFYFIDFQVASVEQYVLILDLFFRKYATESGQVWTRADLEVNIRCRTILEEFLAVALGNHLFGRNATYSVQFRSTLIFVASVLQSSWNSTERHERHDFLFYAVTYFLAQMFPAAHVSIGDEGIPLVLLKALSAYEVTVDKAAWTTVFSGKYAIGDWTSKLLSLESKIENLHDNVLLPSFEERLPGSPTETTTLVQLVKEVNVDAHPQTGAQVDLNGTQNCQENTVVQAVATETGQTMPAPLQGSEAAVDPMSTSESDNQTTTSAEDDHDIGGDNTPTRLSLVESEREEASPQDRDVLSAQGNQTTVLLDSQKHHEMHNEQQSLRGGQSGFNLNAELDNIQTKFDGTNAGWEVRGFQSHNEAFGNAEFVSQSGQIRRQEQGKDMLSQGTLTSEQQQMWLNLQNEQHDSQVVRREWQENKMAQDEQNLQMVRNDQSFQVSNLQRFEMSEEERRKLEYEESQWRRTQRFSETSKAYNTSTSQTSYTSNISKFDSYGSSWSQQNHLNWASLETEQNQVDGNLFY